ncbi:hypothetical protein Vi05172_g2536 [Venturia inaequalis]|nr:hypothetical protein Vi05172_g2536 [Venturia inaequalis]
MILNRRAKRNKIQVLNQLAYITILLIPLLPK